MPYSPYRLFVQNLRRHRGYYALGTLALLLTSLSEVLLPKFIQWSLDLLTAEGKLAQIPIPGFFLRDDSHRTLNVLVASLVLVLLVGWLGRVGWRQILARQTHIAGHDIKTRIWQVLKDQPLSLLERFSLGDLMNRATGDWNKTRFIHGFTIVTVFDLLFFSVLSITSMLMIHRDLALLCLLVIPFLPHFIIRISREESRLHKRAQEQLSILSDLISQSIKTIRLQRATGSEKIWLAKLNANAECYAERQYLVLKTGWKIFILGALPCIIAYGVLFTVGIAKIRAGEISIGAFVALQSYVLLLQTPLFELGTVISEWQTGFASYQRITELYNLEKSPILTPLSLIDSTFDPETALAMQIDHFGYRADFTVLRNLSFKLKRGEKVGLIGPVGSGKSSLLHLAAGLIEGFSGDISVHGLPLAQSGRDWITQQITLVAQRPFLFAGTIRHNLSPAETCTDAEMIEALRSVELWQDVCELPEGLDSWIGEWGINLSGGQKQRLALARALLKPAAILMIDDGLSAVDSITEAKILQNLAQRLSSQTMLWTAHRPSTLALCDRIFTLSEGRLLAFEAAASHPLTLPPPSLLTLHLGREV